MNAFEYSEKPIHLTGEVQNQQFVLTILDEGPGILEELFFYNFRKIFQIPGTSSIGMGLGLAVVRAVVDIHQGQIDVHNRHPTGTSFSISLPL